MGAFFLSKFYSGNYKRYLVLPIALFFVFAALAFISPGITKGVDLLGGSLLIIDAPKPIAEKDVSDFLNKEFDLTDLSVSSISSPLGNKIRIQFVQSSSLALLKQDLDAASDFLKTNPAESKKHSLAVLEKTKAFVSESFSESDDAERLYSLAFDSYLKARQAFGESIKQKLIERFELGEDVALQSEDINPVLGELFWQGALWIGILGIVFILIVIFIFFRELIPSLAIVAAALFDALAALAAMAVFHIPLSLATIPTILLLIGYSIDTDILLTTRVLKRRDSTPSDRAWESLITGMTMTTTAIVALVVMLVLSYFTQLDVMFTIAFILVFGLLADIIATWLMNAPMILWYVEKKHKGVQQ